MNLLVVSDESRPLWLFSWGLPEITDKQAVQHVLLKGMHCWGAARGKRSTDAGGAGAEPAAYQPVHDGLPGPLEHRLRCLGPLSVLERQPLVMMQPQFLQ